MSFDKTTGDLGVIKGRKPSELTAADVLSLILDIILDAQAVSGKELSQLTADEGAAASWLAVTRALSAFPMEELGAQLSERRRAKIKELRERLSEKEKAAAEMTEGSEGETAELLRLEAEAAERKNAAAKLDIQKKELERELGDINKKASETEAEITSLKEKKEKLNTAIADGCDRMSVLTAEIKFLKEQAESFVEQKKTVTAERDSLSAVMSNAENECRAAEKSLNDVRAQLNIHKSRCETYARQQTEVERELTVCQQDLERYRRFFDFDSSKERSERIERYNGMLTLYREAVNSLFGCEPPPTCDLGKLSEEYGKKKDKLNDQLKAAEDALNKLSKEYIGIVAELEKKVNEGAV